MSKHPRKSPAGRRGLGNGTCPGGRTNDTAIIPSASVKLPPMSEAEFDRLMAGLLLHTCGVCLRTQAEVDEYRRNLAKSVNMPERNDDWAPVVERGIELMRGIKRMRALGGDLDGRC